MRSFGFLTNHGLALLCIADDPAVRMRDIAADVNITERAAQRIVSDLIDAGYLSRERVGRRNRYTVRKNLSVSTPERRDLDLNALLSALVPKAPRSARRKSLARSAAAD